MAEEWIPALSVDLGHNGWPLTDDVVDVLLSMYTKEKATEDKVWPHHDLLCRVRGSTVIYGMLGASGIAIFLIPATFCVTERVFAGRNAIAALLSR